MISLAILLVFASFIPEPAYAQRQDEFTIDDLVGRWERWPEKRDEKGIWLYTYITKTPAGSVSVDLKLSDNEQKEFGPSRAGRGPTFEGNFAADGFDVTTECSTKALCFPAKYIFTSADKPAPDVLPRQLRSAPDINVKYRYNIRPLRKDLLLVTAYTPRYTLGDKAFAGAEPEAFVRQFYLTRNDTCEKSKDVVKREIIDGEFGDRLLMVFGQPKPLGAGSRIFETYRSGQSPIQLKGPGCFFFVDLLPTAKFDHPGLFLVVEEETGKLVLRRDVSSPPTIMDTSSEDKSENPLYDTIGERITSADLIFPLTAEEKSRPSIDSPGDGEVVAQIEALSDYTGFRRSVLGNEPVSIINARHNGALQCNSSKKVAVIINGGRDDEFDDDVDIAGVMFSKLGFTQAIRLDWRSHSVPVLREAIKQADKSLGRCDVLVVMYTGHLLRNEGFVGLNHRFPFAGTPHKNSPWSISNIASNPLPASLSPNKPETGRGLLFSLRDLNAGHVSLIVDTCYSGAIIKAATDPSVRLAYGPPVEEFLGSLQTLRILAASRFDQKSQSVPKQTFFPFQTMGSGRTIPAGSLFFQRFAKTVIDLSTRNRVDSNNDGQISRAEYEAAEQNAFDSTKEVLRVLTLEIEQLNPQEPVSITVVKAP